MLTFCEFSNRNYVLFDVGSIISIECPVLSVGFFCNLVPNGHISGYQKIRLFFANCLLHKFFLDSAAKVATHNKPVKMILLLQLFEGKIWATPPAKLPLQSYHGKDSNKTVTKKCWVFSQLKNNFGMINSVKYIAQPIYRNESLFSLVFFSRKGLK